MAHQQEAEPAWGLLGEAWKKRREGSYDEARQLAEEAKGLSEDYEVQGRAFHVFMQLESDNDNYARALELCRQSLAEYEKSGNTDKIAFATRHVADLQYKLGNVDESETSYREAIGLYRSVEGATPGQVANALRGFAVLREAQGHASEAIEAWEEAKGLYASLDIQAGVDEANTKIAALRAAA